MAPSSKETSTISTAGGNIPLKTRVILLGDHGVGKTAFLANIIKMEGEDSVPAKKVRNPFMSSGCVKRMMFEGRDVDVSIHDTAGQERYRSLTSSYYRGINGCLLFYNTHNQSSFNNLSNWLDDLRRYTDKNPAIVLVGINTRLYKTSSVPRDNSRRSGGHGNTSVSTNRGPGANFRQLRNSFRRRKCVSGANYSTLKESTLDTSNDVTANHGVQTSSDYKVNHVGKYSRSNSKNSDSHKAGKSLVTKSTSMPCINYNTMHQPFDSCHHSRHKQKHGNINGSCVNDDPICGDRDTEECGRIISEEQARNFAYAHEIPYREVDLESDYSAIENVLDRILQMTLSKERRSSVWSDSTIVKPSLNSHPSLFKRCCSCIH